MVLHVDAPVNYTCCSQEFYVEVQEAENLQDHVDAQEDVATVEGIMSLYEGHLCGDDDEHVSETQFSHEPTVNVSTSVPSTVPEILTQLHSPPIGGCHEGPPRQVSPYASIRHKLRERRCHSCCDNVWW